MRPIIKWNLRDRRGAAIGWSVGINIYIALNILVYGSIKSQADALNKALQNLPASARALFGGSSDFLSPVGYLNSKLYYLILPLLFTLLGITMANHLLGREEQDGTLELLLARPISRVKLLLSKIISWLLIILGVGLTALLVTILCAKAVSYDVSLWRITQATGLTLLISCLFGCVTWALLGLGRGGKRAAVGAGSFVALGSYLFSSLENLVDWLKWPAKLLPYHYYNPSAILNGTYNWWNAAGMLLAAIVIFSLAFAGFRRRDIS